MPAIKYETARNLRWNLHFFFAVLFIAVPFGVWQAYGHVVDQMPASGQVEFNTWLENHARTKLIPGSSLTQVKARRELRLVDAIPEIKADFEAKAEIIFKWTPIGVFLTQVLVWFLGHVIAGYVKQTSGKK